MIRALYRAAELPQRLDLLSARSGGGGAKSHPHMGAGVYRSASFYSVTLTTDNTLQMSGHERGNQRAAGARRMAPSAVNFNFEDGSRLLAETGNNVVETNTRYKKIIGCGCLTE